MTATDFAMDFSGKRDGFYDGFFVFPKNLLRLFVGDNLQRLK